MSLPPLLHALLLSVLALSQARVVSRCELRDELLKLVQLPRNLQKKQERAMARVICEVERFSCLDLHFIREYTRTIVDFGNATTAPTSTAPPPPPTTPPPRPPTTPTTPPPTPPPTTLPPRPPTTTPPPRPPPTTPPTPPPTTPSSRPPSTTPPPRPPTTTPEPPPPSTIPPTPYPEVPEPTTTKITTSTPAPPSTPPPRPPTTTTTTEAPPPPPTTDLIRGDDVGGANTSSARGRRSLREKRASISVESVKFFGIFQFSDQKYCYSGYSDSEDRCKSDCFAFADDDISDDVQCFVQTGLFWDVYRGAQRSCRSKRSLDSFFGACDAGEEPGIVASVDQFVSIRRGNYK